MTIFDKKVPDRQGRITLGPEYILEDTTAVIFVVEDATEMISVRDVEDTYYGPVSKIDQKNRVAIPKWLMDELGDNIELFCVEMDGKFYLSKKTGYII